MPPDDLTFEPFASHEFYTDLNRSLIRQARSSVPPRADAELSVVDMGCGPGAVTRLIADELGASAILGVDPSETELERARARLEDVGARVAFICADVSELPRIATNPDVVFFCNAIHLIADKLAALQTLFASLRPGGVLAFNTGFFDGAYVPGTERFYRLWTRKAVGWLRKNHPGARAAREEKPIAMQWLTPDEYVLLARRAGFAEVHVDVLPCEVSLDALRDIARYRLFVEGALPGVPQEQASLALRAAVALAADELGISEIRRAWLQVVASKSSPAT